MFRRIAGTLESSDIVWLTLSIDGQEVSVPKGETVAAAMLLQEKTRFRQSLVSGSDRAPYCLMGACFECLVTIDGVKNRQACMCPVADGMVVERQINASIERGEAQ